ncbi:MAG: hypothetical protein C4294_19050, partial [Nitrospiraceae bacterium]
MTICFATWRWDQLIRSDQAAAPGVYRLQVHTADATTPFSANSTLEAPTTGQLLPSCPQGCGGLQATPNGSGGLQVRYTNLTGQVLYTSALSYTVERQVKDAWGLVFGAAPVLTGTLRLYPGQTLTWSWAA